MVSDRNCADSSQGHIVTLEITSGEVYRGKLIEGVLPQIVGD
jgi:small nuclear ribonucleoprotein (snRNP)-like protein